MTGITRSASWELKMDTDSEGSDYKATRVTDCMPKNYKYKNNCNVGYLIHFYTNLGDKQIHRLK